MKKQTIVIVAAFVLIASFLLGAFVYKTRQKETIRFMAEKNTGTFVREYSPTFGNHDAKVYLVKFSDPACETCSAFHPFVKQLMAKHSGKIKLILRYAPFHEGSEFMVKILEAAKKQDKFWEALDVMYTTQRDWASHHNPQPQLIWQFLPMAGLDLDQIRIDMRDPEIEKRIRQDLADADVLNVTKTPGFFVNGKPLVTFGYETLQTLVENEIKAQY